MNTDRLTGFIADTASLKDYDIPYLEELVKEHPYFQLAHILLLYSYKKTKAENFTLQLRKSALFVPDRRKLFNLLYDVSVQQVDINDDVAKYTDKDEIESVEFQFDDSKTVLTIEEEPINNTFTEVEIPPQELLEFEENDFVTEKDQARVVEFETSVEGTLEPAVEDNDVKEVDFSLIDKFIEESPVFTPNRIILDEPREDISTPSLQEDDSLVTETLASIFEKQNLHEKAIAVYEKLILKIPEKSTYFASRINELKKNIK